jgi:ribosomal protein S15P/S13E
MDKSILEQISEWVSSDGEKIQLGHIAWRTSVMTAYIKDENVQRDNDLGISYAIGFQNEHIKTLNPTGIQIMVRAYNNLKQHIRNNPLQPAEETNGSTN